MEIGFILSLIVVLVVLYFGFRLLKSLIKTLMMAAVVLIVIIAGVGFLVWNDVQDLRENFSNSTKLMLLADEDELVFGLEVTTLDMEGVDVISFGALDSWQDDYQDKKYKNILGEHYKLFILKNEAFDEDIGSADEMVTKLKGYFDELDVLFLLQEYKEGNIIIYPETTVFKLVKLIPNGLVDRIADRIGGESDAE